MAKKQPTQRGGATPPPEEAFKEEVFKEMAALEGFNLAGFDTWLAEFGDCDVKRELLERREQAKEAARPGQVNREALLRHLEWMMLCWGHLSTTAYIKPLAKIGRRLKAGGAKGAEASRKSRRGPDSKRAKIIEKAREYKGSPRARAAWVAKKAAASPQHVRRVLKEENL